MDRYLIRKIPRVEEDVQEGEKMEEVVDSDSDVEEEERPGPSQPFTSTEGAASHDASTLGDLSMNAQDGPKRPILQILFGFIHVLIVT